MIQKGADVNVVGEYGETPLTTATFQSKCIKELISIITYFSSSLKCFNCSPLLFIEYEEIVRFLIEKGANINATNENGDSALIRAATTGKG